LNIGGTDINTGLECLPEGLRKIGCGVMESIAKEQKCSTIKEELEKAKDIEITSEKSVEEKEKETK